MVSLDITGSRNHIELEFRVLRRIRDTAQHPKEIVLIRLLGLLPHRTGLVPWQVGLHLYVDKLGACEVAALLDQSDLSCRRPWEGLRKQDRILEAVDPVSLRAERDRCRQLLDGVISWSELLGER